MIVLGQTDKRDALNRKYFLCRCPCGRERQVREDVIKSGLAATKCSACRRLRHGDSRSPEHRTWLGIMWRCVDPKNAKYCGRGIRVCERWKTYENFLADMGRKPGPDYTIERKDNDGDYAPENCVWLPAARQALNRRTSHIIELDGERHCVEEWSRISGTKGPTIRFRLRHGWTPRHAIYGKGT